MKKNFIAIMTIIVCFLACGAFSNVARAATSQQVCNNNSANGAIKDACSCVSEESWTYGCGMLWISGSSSRSDISDTVTSTQSSGTITIYLHGAVFASSDAKAKRIKLIKGTSRITGISNANRYSTYAPFSNTPSEINRVHNTKTGTFKSTPVAFNLNIDKLIQVEGNNFTTSGNNRIYTIPIQVFRCFGNRTADDACWSSRSDVKIIIPQPKVTLTANAKITPKNSAGEYEVLKNGICSVTVNYNSNATCTAPETITKGAYTYAWYKWGSNGACKDAGTNRTCTVKNMKSNTTVNAYYKKQITLTLTADAVTPDGTMIKSNMSSDSKTVNSGSSASLSVSALNFSGFTFKGWRDNRYSGGVSGTTTLTKSITSNTTVYAVYEPFNATSTLFLSVDKYYARPEQNLIYNVAYNPKAQGGYSISPQMIKINNGTPYTISTTLGAALGDWKNAFAVYGSKWNQDFVFIAGDATSKYPTHSVAVHGADVGNVLTETAETNVNANVSRTPKTVSISMWNGSILGTVDTSNLKSSTSTSVPYNFENSTSIDPAGQNVVYAGESKAIKLTVYVGKIKNSLVGGDEYATIVRNAKWKLQLCYDSSCSSPISSEPATGEFNSSHSLSPSPETKDGLKINIPDLPAGTKIWIRSAVYPKNSGTPGNLKADFYNPDDPASWAYSAPTEFVVAKKPSLQVWGGNVYSGSGINTATAVKRSLAGSTSAIFDINDNKNPETHVFGSWSELGIISTGLVSGFSSGASLGYADTLVPNPFGNNASGTAPGGSEKKSICDRSHLTFANTCKNGVAVGLIGTSASISKVSSDKNSIIAKLAPAGEPNVTSTSISINDDPDQTYYYSSNDLTVQPGGATGNIVRTKTIRSDKNITIDGNLVTTGKFDSLEAIPHFVVYAKNIYIDCDVTQIDALLIAEEAVVTCDNLSSDLGGENSLVRRANNVINDAENSHQLMINGAVVAGSLIANRTYGAASGSNSIIPAEIINFNPVYYQWSGNIENSDDTSDDGKEEKHGSLDTVLLYELAPRK